MKKIIAYQRYQPLSKKDIETIKNTSKLIKAHIKNSETKLVLNIGASFAWPCKIIEDQLINKKNKKVPLHFFPYSGKSLTSQIQQSEQIVCRNKKCKPYYRKPIESSSTNKLRQMLTNRNITPSSLLQPKNSLTLIDMTHSGIGLRGFCDQLEQWVDEHINSSQTEHKKTLKQIYYNNIKLLIFQPPKDKKKDNLKTIFKHYAITHLNSKKLTFKKYNIYSKDIEKLCDSDTGRLTASNPIDQHFIYEKQLGNIEHYSALLKQTQLSETPKPKVYKK